MYGALGAALWGTRVGCVSLVGTDYPVTMLDALEERRVDLTGLHRLPGPGVRTWLLYEGHLRRLIHRLGCPTHEQVSPGPEHIPRAWRSAPAFHLAPMPFTAQRRLLASLTMEPSHFVSVDPHLPITHETLEDWRDALAEVDAFFPSEDELLLEETQVHPERVLPRLATGRLRFIVFKQAARGGILYDAREDRFHRWLGRASKVIDPTGAGDAFAAGFVSARLEGLPTDAPGRASSVRVCHPGLGAACSQATDRGRRGGSVRLRRRDRRCHRPKTGRWSLGPRWAPRFAPSRRGRHPLTGK